MLRFCATVLALGCVAQIASAAPTVLDESASTSVSGYSYSNTSSGAYGGSIMVGMGLGAKRRYTFDTSAIGGAGSYKIYATWPAYSSSYSTRVQVGGVTLLEFNAGSAAAADISIGGKPFKLAGTVTAGSSLVVDLTDNGTYQALFDAIAIELDAPPPVVETWTIVDSLYSSTGWSSFPVGRGGATFVSPVGATADTYYARFDATGLAAGKYKVFYSQPDAPRTGVYGNSGVGAAGISYTKLSTNGNSYKSTTTTNRATSGVTHDGSQWTLLENSIDVAEGGSIILSVTNQAGKRVMGDAMAVVRYAVASADTVDEGGSAPSESPVGGDTRGDVSNESPPPPDPDPQPDPTTPPGSIPDPDWASSECPQIALHGVSAGPGYYPAHWKYDQFNGVERSLLPFPSERVVKAWVASFDHFGQLAYGGDARITVQYYCVPPLPNTISTYVAGEGRSYHEIELRVGRNGFVTASDFNTFNVWPGEPGMGFSGKSYLLPVAVFDSLLKNPDGLPIGASGVWDPTPKASACLYPPATSEKLEALLTKLRNSLIGPHVDFTDLIPRSPDQSFDPGSGGGFEGGAAPEEGEPETDTDGDGVPDYRDAEPNNAASKGVKGYTDDANFFTRWGSEFNQLKGRLKTPFGNAAAPSLSQTYPGLVLDIPQFQAPPAQLAWSLQPDGSPVGLMIEAARVMVRALSLLFIVVQYGHKVLTVLQRW